MAADRRRRAPAVSAVSADSVASAPAVVPSGRTPQRPPRPLVHVGLGDAELRIDAASLIRMILDPLTEMLNANVVMASMVRSAALMGYPALRKVMRAARPDYPPPDIPRGADPVVYLATYLLTVAGNHLLEWHWTLDYVEHRDGAVEVTGARPDTRMSADDHAADGADDGAGEPVGPVDSADSQPTARTA